LLARIQRAISAGKSRLRADANFRSAAITALRSRWFLAAALTLAATGSVAAFDIEAHRGGRALFPENTLPAFANALSIGVDTLELDMGVTQDEVIVVSHDRRLNPDLARTADGAYVTPPGTPFVRLRLEDVKNMMSDKFAPAALMRHSFRTNTQCRARPFPTLAEVFGLVRKSGNDHVRLNIETKIDPNHPDESPDPARFVTLVLGLLQAENFSDRVTIQSFDWRTLQLVQKLAPRIPTVYLSQQAGFAPTVFRDKASPWTAGFNPQEHGRSLPRTIKTAGGAIWSPYYGDVDPAVIDESHRLGLTVVVWTVTNPPTWRD
jgi:glycerophosphoryl diester phosphodiesterase